MTAPVIRPRSDHSISRSLIDPDVLKVLYRLHRAGYKAYLVGGSVRDLLLGRTPKDFDIGTDAHPQDVKRLFRNCRIIGRRFRLAHVYFRGGKTVEVATFRRRPEPTEGDGDLLITEDNTFGTPVEDALRRDFTVNGLFYDIGSFSVLDYVGGLVDIENRVIRVIGDPDVRFREDPVRMLRAVEFAARLDFTLDLDAYDAILRHQREILRSAAPRVTEELLGMLRSTRPLASFRLLRETGLFDVILPEIAAVVASEPAGGAEGGLFWSYLAHLETEVSRGAPAGDDRLLLGLLLLSIVFPGIARRLAAGGTLDSQELVALIDDAVNPLVLRLSLPNASVHAVKQAILALGKLGEPIKSPAAARRLAGRQYFPLAFSLFRIHSTITGRHVSAVETWERFLEEGEVADAPPSPESPAAKTGAAPRRRRRRRRAPAVPKPPAPPEGDLRFRD